ncbi:uncharacterized protein L969DRAFT_199583 [Mixia osmundae IAM 14324]|uniref:Ysc84 actin-binding domain-containing protein n=1 Tax=Mixia osmundae (strain CBS 9802 / IAM 14324 / JCM 22182 / KY 12970) TaxID=764103 RepID=G7DUY2_MIXOS|nr:uncharacterized protein L969DRAFT_199583 [Mixia osmundae IAM 14324]KEI37391.1 hypothetical protein L969DRAFT_199583 [Mixia osmundae IAM 14324]GAA94392.1 hypothetical protein E5Q_01043 [Mixia osmundae IAM 14324]
MSQPPPPPRRTVAALPSASTASGSQSPGFWGKTKSVTRSGWDGLYKTADKIGHYSNKQTAKLGIEAFYPTSLDLECSKAARILRTFTLDRTGNLDHQDTIYDEKKKQRIIKKIPSSALASCRGICIFTVFRTGFILSGAGGSGVVMSKDASGTWSGPSGILLHVIGFGFLAGVDVYDVVLILRTEAAVRSFANPRVTLGAELSVAAGPIGNGVSLEAGVEASPVWSYSKSRGLYGGLQLDGNIVIERNDENARFYNRRVSAKEILAGEMPVPYESRGLIQTIQAASGLATATDLIPQGASLADEYVAPPHRLDPEAEDEQDKKDREELAARLADFGIDDPDINRKMRETDSAVLRGPELEALSSPEPSISSPRFHSPLRSPSDVDLHAPRPAYLTSTTADSSADSVYSDDAVSAKDGDLGAPLQDAPPMLPARRAVPAVPPPLPARHAVTEVNDGPSMADLPHVDHNESATEALPAFDGQKPILLVDNTGDLAQHDLSDEPPLTAGSKTAPSPFSDAFELAEPERPEDNSFTDAVEEAEPPALPARPHAEEVTVAEPPALPARHRPVPPAPTAEPAITTEILPAAATHETLAEDERDSLT